MKKINEYLTIKQAAEFLGVSRVTLINWDISGKLPAIKFPLNQARYYEQEDLERVLNSFIKPKE